QRRDFLHFTRGPDRHRELATPLQHDQAPRLNRIQATSARGVRARIRRVAGCATPTGSAGHAGATANLKLTFHLDHSAGADHHLVRPRSDWDEDPGYPLLSGGVAVRSLRTGDVPERKAPLRAGLDSVLRATGEEGLASPRGAACDARCSPDTRLTG